MESFLLPMESFQNDSLHWFGVIIRLLFGIKVSFWSDVGDFKMTLERVRMQINSLEVLFYTDLESSFWSNVGAKTTIKVETAH